MEKKKTYRPLPLVREFMDEQPQPVRAEYERIIDTLEKDGFLARPHGEKVEPGLFAMRIMSGGNVRVFYVYDDGVNVYGIHAYEKKSRTIPYHELVRARRMMRGITRRK